MLYRLSYRRNSIEYFCTFSAADFIQAAAFSELWEHLTKLPVTEMQPIGQSKIPTKAYSRLHQALTKEEQFQMEIPS